MCDDHPGTLPPRADGRLDRRQVLFGGAALVTGVVASTSVGAARPVEVMPGLRILPRTTWGSALPPRPGLVAEDDVRLLLVHHTASPNSWPAVHTMQVAYRTHTEQKGWPDVCYNLFVARDGTVYEGRAGSLDRPVRADATGGSQGYSQLVCLLGDYTSELPTPEAWASLVKALAWLAVRSGVSTRRGAACTFTSRGSNRYPSGTEVTSPTIAPHRSMSQTACPGDALAPFVGAALMRDVRRQRAAWRRAGAIRTVQPGAGLP